MLKVNDWYYRGSFNVDGSLGLLYKITAINGNYIDVDCWKIMPNRKYEWVSDYKDCDAIDFEKNYNKTVPLPKVVEVLYSVKSKLDNCQETDTQIEYTDSKAGTDTA